MNTQHTPGRIVLSQVGHFRQVDQVAPLRLADAPAGWAEHAEALANSRRLVALWNAGQGIATEEWERVGAVLDPFRRLVALAALAGSAAAAAARAAVKGEDDEEAPDPDAFPSSLPLQAGSHDTYVRPTNGDQWDGC